MGFQSPTDAKKGETRERAADVVELLCTPLFTLEHNTHGVECRVKKSSVLKAWKRGPVLCCRTRAHSHTRARTRAHTRAHTRAPTRAHTARLTAPTRLRLLLLHARRRLRGGRRRPLLVRRARGRHARRLGAPALQVEGVTVTSPLHYRYITVTLPLLRSKWRGSNAVSQAGAPPMGP